MIPKIIHYCWFGGNELSDLAKKCIQSWKKYCPDYKIKEWNESNFDVNCNLFVKEAYKAKKWAFVSDYVRLYVLIKEGGIYLDTDVEIIKPLNCFCYLNAFIGFEKQYILGSAIIGAEKNNNWVKYLISYYNDKCFINKDGSYNMVPNVEYITNMTNMKYNLLLENNYYNLENNFHIYPMDYFSPKDSQTGRINKTRNTYVIHHFDGSWLSNEEYKKRDRIKKLSPYLGVSLSKFILGTIFYYKKGGIKEVFYKIKEKYKKGKVKI